MQQLLDASRCALGGTEPARGVGGDGAPPRRGARGRCAGRRCAAALPPPPPSPHPQSSCSRRAALRALTLAAVGGAGCRRARGATTAASAAARGRAVAALDADGGASFFMPPTRVTAPGRVVALGDLHGDMPQTMRALQLAGVVGLERGRAVWTGGNTTLVQMGDILDRGDEEIGILFLLQRLAEGAEEAGGAVYVLNGNHEILNVSGDFRYVTAGAFQESARFGRRLEELFGDVEAGGGPHGDPANEDDAWETALRTRVGLFAPGGPLAQQFARHSTVLVVNDTVFAHGGLLPAHVNYGLERLNAGVSRWMLGESAEELEEALALAAGSSDSVVWNRQFAKERWGTPAEQYTQCSVLRQALALVPGAKRLVVGHTPQIAGCNCVCDGQVWRIDVGLSRGVLGAGPQVLEIDGDSVRVLSLPSGAALASAL